MSMTTVMLVLLVGLLIGIVSGMVGIGGGVLVIPVLMFGFGFSQVRANGTSMAMLLPPIGVFAVLTYWRAGNIDWRFAGLLATGFAVGAFVGAKLVNSGSVNPTALRVVFAVLLLYVAGRVLFPSGSRARAAFETSLLIVGFTLAFAAMQLLGRRWERPRRNWAAVYRSKRHDPVGHDYEI